MSSEILWPRSCIQFIYCAVVRPTPPRPKLYDLIERQTRRLVRLVDELLDVARISSGHIQLKRESVDLAAVAQNAAQATEPRIRNGRRAERPDGQP
jgi:signal transduction histidine kinase